MQRIWYRKAESSWFLTVRENGRQKQLRLLRGPNDKETRRKAEEAAVRELATRPADSTPATAAWITVGHVLDGVLRHSKENHEPSTYEWYDYFFSTFTRHRDLRIGLLKKQHIHEWLGSRKLSDTTANRGIGAIKRAFAWAVEEEHIPRSPIEHLRKPQGAVRDRTVSPEERGVMLAAIPDDAFRDYFVALSLTGARPGEVRRVRAEDVDLERGCWVLKKHKTVKKTGKPRIIYLSPEALDLTKKLMEKRPTGPLFLNTRGDPWTKNAIRLRFTKLRKDHPQLKGVISYTLRSAFATDALEAGVPDTTVATLLGHTNTNTLHRFYARISHKVAHLQDAAAKATHSAKADEPPRGKSA